MPAKQEKQPISVTHPALAKEACGWDPAKLDASSGKNVDWICSLGHKWTTRLNYRVHRKSKCPFCINQKVWVGFNDFATTHPEMLNELLCSDGTDFVAGSTTKICQWRCPQGHIYDARPQYRTVRKQGCPVCAGKKVQVGFNDLSTTYPEIASEAFEFDPTTLTAGSNVTVKWKCSYGHIFSAQPHQRQAHQH